MALSDQIDAYVYELELFEKAEADPKGIRLPVKSESAGRTLRFRMHQARALHRKETTRVYPRDDPRYGKSAYDPIGCYLRQDTEDKWWLYLERRGLDIDLDAVESLSEEAAE